MPSGVRRSRVVLSRRDQVPSSPLRRSTTPAGCRRATVRRRSPHCVSTGAGCSRATAAARSFAPCCTDSAKARDCTDSSTPSSIAVRGARCSRATARGTDAAEHRDRTRRTHRRRDGARTPPVPSYVSNRAGETHAPDRKSGTTATVQAARRPE